MAKSSTSFTKANAAAKGRKGARLRWKRTTKAERRDHAMKMVAARYGRYVLTGKC